MERGISKIWNVTHQTNDPNHTQGWVLEPGHWEAFDPFLLMAEDWFKKGTFGFHPHRGIETVTYVIDGELQHKDNRGGEGVLHSGDVQWMTAGKGILHAEEPVEDSTVHSLQLWVNLPSEEKMTETRYQDLYQRDMPVFKDNGSTIRLFSGSYNGHQSSTFNHVPITMLDITLYPEKETTIDLPPSYNGFLYVLDGSASFGPDEQKGNKNQVLWMSREPDAKREQNSTLQIKTSDEKLHVILYAGEPVKERVVARGPFVMNSEEEIKQAFLDYHRGVF